MGLISPNLYCNNRYIGNIGQYAAYDNSEGGSKSVDIHNPILDNTRTGSA